MTGHRNGLKTALLLGLMSALVLAAGSLFGQGGLLIALVVALGLNGYAYFYSDKLALRSMRAQPVTREQAPHLHRVVGELAATMQIPEPRIFVSPTSAPNAFATGRNPEHAAVCCTEGILELLDDRELRGVLGHELAHVGNRDILISSVAGALAAVIVYMAQFVQLSALFGRGGDSRNNPFSLLLLVLLGPLAAGLVRSAVSRNREFQADETGAQVTGDPLALASALRKLEQGTAARPLAQTAGLSTTSSLMIANPFGRGAGIGNLFSTHPPMADRIARLQAMTTP